MTSAKKNRRPLVGLFISGLDSKYPAKLWPGVRDGLREQGAELLLYPGKPLASPYDNERQYNILYDLAKYQHLDALIVSTTLFGHVDEHQNRAFVESFDIPIVLAGLHMDGFPSIAVDNRYGVKEALRHLVEVHGHRNIAYVTGPLGNQEAKERLEAYRESLEGFDIPFDQNLICEGDFTPFSGRNRVEQLLRQNHHIDSIVFGNDDMIEGAYDVFDAHQIRIPDDIAIVGFDDVKEARLNLTVPLTTVQQPIYTLGRRAAKTAFALVKNEQVDEKVVLSTELVIRSSCGCAPATDSERDNNSSYELLGRSGFSVEMQVERINENLANLADPSRKEEIVHYSHEILKRIERAEHIDQYLSGYLDELKQLLSYYFKSGDEIQKWQRVLNEINYFLYSRCHGGEYALKAKAIFQKSRILLGEIARYREGGQSLSLYQNMEVLNYSLKNIISKFELDKLIKFTYKELYALKVRSCNVSRFEHPITFVPENSPSGFEPPQKCEPYMEYIYDSRCMLPFIGEQEEFSCLSWVGGPDVGENGFVVLPVFSNRVHFGIAFFEIGDVDVEIFELFSLQLGNMINACQDLLEEKNMSSQLEHEMSIWQDMYLEQQQTQEKYINSARRAEQNSNSKVDYLKNMSRALKSPLNTMTNFAEMLEIDAFTRSDDIANEIKQIHSVVKGISGSERELGIKSKIETSLTEVSSKIESGVSLQHVYLSKILSELKQYFSEEETEISKMLKDAERFLNEESALRKGAYNQIKEFGSAIVKEIKTSLDSIELDVTKPDYGQEILEVQTVNLPTFIETIGFDFDGEGQQPQVKVELNLEGQEIGTFDESTIRNVIERLIMGVTYGVSDALVLLIVEYFDGQHRVVVHCSNASLSDREQRQLLAFADSDADSFSRRVVSLGEAKQLLKGQRGELFFDSNPKTGLRTWFYIPILEKH